VSGKVRKKGEVDGEAFEALTMVFYVVIGLSFGLGISYLNMFVRHEASFLTVCVASVGVWLVCFTILLLAGARSDFLRVYEVVYRKKKGVVE